MDPIVVAAGTALVSAIATDGWRHARDAVAALWRRARPDQAGEIEPALDALRAEVLQARVDGDSETEQALEGAWRLRLQQMVRARPEVAVELRALLDEVLSPGADAAGRGVNIAGRDLYSAGRDQTIHHR